MRHKANQERDTCFLGPFDILISHNVHAWQERFHNGQVDKVNQTQPLITLGKKNIATRYAPLLGYFVASDGNADTIQPTHKLADVQVAGKTATELASQHASRRGW